MDARLIETTCTELTSLLLGGRRRRDMYRYHQLNPAFQKSCKYLICKRLLSAVDVAGPVIFCQGTAAGVLASHAQQQRQFGLSPLRFYRPLGIPDFWWAV